MSVDTDERIAKLNDEFRKTAEYIYFTSGVRQFGLYALTEINLDLRAYNDFNANNDPYGEHDFGSFEYEGNKLFWKIDYYATQDCRYMGDPLDPQCKRVLTVMLAEEY